MTWSGATQGVANWYDSAGYGEFLYGETLFGGGVDGSWSQVTSPSQSWSTGSIGSLTWTTQSSYPVTWT